MIALAQIKEIKYDINVAEINQLFSFTSNNVFENNITYTPSAAPYTILSRDSNGRCKVSDPSDALDVVNLQYLSSNYFGLDNAESFFQDSPSIIFTSNESPFYITARVKAAGTTGDIQKNVSSNLAASSMLNEDSLNGVLRLSRNKLWYGYTQTNSVLQITHNKPSNNQADISIETAAFALTDGPLIQIYAHRNSNDDPNVLIKSKVLNDQSLLKLQVFGAINLNDVAEAFKFEIKSNSDFSVSTTSHFEMNQIGANVPLILSSTYDGDIIVGNGLRVGDTSNSITGNIRFNNTHFQGYNGTTWLNLDEDADGIATETEIVATISSGGITKGDIIPVGTTIEDIIKLAFAPFITSQFDTFIVNGNIIGQDIEIGRTFIVSDAEFTIINDSDNIPTSDITINGFGFESATPVISSPHSADSVNKNLILSSAGPYNWIIQGLDSKSNLVSKTYTINSRYRFSFGASSIELTSSSTDVDVSNVINALQQSWLMDGIEKQVICTFDNKLDDNYTYIAYSSSYGEINHILKFGVDVTDSFTLIGEFNYTNTYGYISSYYLYKSNYSGAFGINNELNIR
jgi:hypothetical protein